MPDFSSPSDPRATDPVGTPPARRRLAALAVVVTTSLLLAACAATAPREAGDAGSRAPAAASQAASAPASDGIRAARGWVDLGPRELVAALETVPVAQRPTDLHTSVTPREIVLMRADGVRETVPLPDDAFPLSFAPYRTTTHDCFSHSPTGCIGEFAGTAFHVRIVDRADGTVVVDQTMTSFDNGFIGVWLPRGIDADLTVERDGEAAHATIRTGDDDPTCLTTLRLT